MSNLDVNKSPVTATLEHCLGSSILQHQEEKWGQEIDEENGTIIISRCYSNISIWYSEIPR